MPNPVFLADLRAGHRENLLDKIERLLADGGLDEIVARDDLVAVKVHFGERGSHGYVRPVFLRRVVECIRAAGGKPFLTDSSTLYPGERKEAVSALSCGIENGFAYAVVGAPLIMCDGLRGHSARRVPVSGELLTSVDIALGILEADAQVTVSHFKGHDLTGFGGAIKNLAMGCSSREGKLEQHSNVAPKVAEKYCTACGACCKACVHDAVAIIEGAAVIDAEKCAGCGRCITVCAEKAIKIQWSEEAPQVMKKMAEYATGAVEGKSGKTLYLSFVTDVSPSCDCYGHSDAPVVPDIGILVSTDPVAIDQAAVDLVNQATGIPGTALQTGHEPGGDKFRGMHPQIDYEVTLEHAEKMGLGSRSYELVRLEPKGKGW